MKKQIKLTLLLLVLLVGVGGCDLTKQYKISSISLEKTDLNFNQDDNLKIYYTIENNADLTLSPKVEVNLNETCFSIINDKELGNIPPKQSIRTYNDVRLKWKTPDYCKGKSYKILIILKDVNGKSLDSKTISLGIV